ncbi:unnamed protein product [Brugia timori]|uniref:Non-structural maintenance of chromosomes element 4 n=1 Tax=Brugia timori TaxID=42155 RepID=A0A0R3QSP4_9BILA|nr:unnamed protein product [Brugia timori]
METTSSSNDIQRGFDEKIRFNEEKRKLIESIRDKYKGLIRREKTVKQFTNTLFEPIVTPLKRVIEENTSKEDSRIKEEPREEKNDDIVDSRESISKDEKLQTSKIKQTQEHSKKDHFAENIKQIIRKVNRNLNLGFNVLVDERNKGLVQISTKANSYPVKLDYKNRNLEVNGKQYPLSTHLAELLFSSKVATLNPTASEIETYNQILRDVGDLDHMSKIMNKNNKKYQKFIREPVYEQPSSSSNQYGEGPNAKNLDLKILTDKNEDIRYIYWNSPSELIYRLCLLKSTKQAGNTNPQINKEIQSIENQLRQANIIE